MKRKTKGKWKTVRKHRDVLGRLTHREIEHRKNGTRSWAYHTAWKATRLYRDPSTNRPIAVDEVTHYGIKRYRWLAPTERAKVA